MYPFARDHMTDYNNSTVFLYAKKENNVRNVYIDELERTSY